MRYRVALAYLGRLVPLLARCVSLIALTGCLSEPVQWGDVSYRQSQLGDPDTRSSEPGANLPLPNGSFGNCTHSVRAAGAGSDLFRVWWAARTDSSVILSMQSSTDSGASWQKPVTVDSGDRGGHGCARPAPGIFYDQTKGYLHIVYFIEASDGAGVFFAHSMDNGAMFHSPVPVVYGNRPSRASVAANGDSVVVVFEDPNALSPRIGIALSHTTGHIFETRGEATPDDVPAIDPWVTLSHRTITVWWNEGENAEGRKGNRVGYRTGTWN
jgi:hypothetical protein